ncbi:hypothetical protein H4Q26_001826 [Puccinia striiformis f. sp. tritici PST-130]|nr:hypothetical protein H4Q26_001826 [Puccinia striiformis f. sp. tritici PST-130]
MSLPETLKVLVRPQPTGRSVPTQQDERRFGPDSKLEGLKPARCVHQQSRSPRASPRTSRHRPITPLGQENC